MIHAVSWVYFPFPFSLPVQNITARLTPNPVEPPVNASVREATAIMASLPSVQHQMEIHIDNTSSKLNRIRSIVASIPFALHLMNDSWVSLSPSRRTTENPFTSEISFDIKVNSSEGILLYMVGEQHNLTSGHPHELVSVTAFFPNSGTSEFPTASILWHY